MTKLIWVLCIVFLEGCESEYPWKLKPEADQGIVVDAIITDENTAQWIQLAQVNSLPNKLPVPISHALITVSDSAGSYLFSESGQIPGRYVSPPFKAIAGRQYTLTISSQSIVYTATAIMAPISPLENMDIVNDNTTGLDWYNNVISGEPAMIEVFYDWSADQDYCRKYGNSLAQETFYILKNNDVNQIFAPDKEVIYFPPGTKIIRKKYSLTTEHQQFIRSLLMETDWRGGLFDVLPGNVLSNINHGAHGFFGVCMVLSDSTVVK